jgi:hypothetical protein
MREGDARDRDAQLRGVREIDRRLATRRRHLLKVHFGFRSVQRAPVPESALERPHLAIPKLVRMLVPEELQDHLRFEHTFRVAPQQRLDLRGPDAGERVRPRSPIACVLRHRRERPALPLPCGPQAEARRRCRRLLGVSLHAPVPQQPNLCVCDHERPIGRTAQRRPATWPQAADLIVAAQAEVY